MWLRYTAAIAALVLTASLASAQETAADKTTGDFATKPVANHGAAKKPREVTSLVELYTSQGCSSCPPADKLLQSYITRPNVVGLSFAVDYWDYLGWKDTLASSRNTRRQKAYAKALGTGNVYTPQMVINGVAHAVGSRKKAIDTALEQTIGDIEGHSIAIDAIASQGKVIVSVGAAASSQPNSWRSGTVWLATVKPHETITITRGENTGRKLSYHNVVRELTPIGIWTGKVLRIELPKEQVLSDGERGAVFVQTGKIGRVLAATWIRN